jgi:hypothetical protein
MRGEAYLRGIRRSKEGLRRRLEEGGVAKRDETQ